MKYYGKAKAGNGPAERVETEKRERPQTLGSKASWESRDLETETSQDLLGEEGRQKAAGPGREETEPDWDEVNPESRAPLAQLPGRTVVTVWTPAAGAPPGPRPPRAHQGIGGSPRYLAFPEPARPVSAKAAPSPARWWPEHPTGPAPLPSPRGDPELGKTPRQAPRPGAASRDRKVSRKREAQVRKQPLLRRRRDPGSSERGAVLEPEARPSSAQARTPSDRPGFPGGGRESGLHDHSSHPNRSRCPPRALLPSEHRFRAGKSLLLEIIGFL